MEMTARTASIEPDAGRAVWSVRIRPGAIGGVLRCPADQSLLAVLGPAAHVPIGCRGGGCGVCAVRVIDGIVEKGIMSKRHLTPDMEARGITLACRTFPRSDLTIAIEREGER